MNILVILLLSFWRNTQHFHLVTVSWSLHRTMVWWHRSASCRCCTLAKGQHAKHNQTLSWRQWNYERVPSDVPNMFQSTSSLNISSVVLLRDLKHACSSSKISSAWLTSLLRIACNMTMLGWSKTSGWSFCMSGRVVCCLFWNTADQSLCPVLGPLSISPDFLT